MNIDGKELEYLLNHYWCVKEASPKEYFNIKNKLDYYKDFIRDKLGSRLIVNDRFIKLEKIPASAKPYMGISSFHSKIEYTILFIILLYLEDKPRLEQFILSSLTDFITTTATSLELDTIPNWNIMHHRKCFVNVMKHLKERNIIKVVEENNLFTEDSKAEALYETTGIANFYVREFKNNVLEYNSINDYVNDEFGNQNENIGDVRRYKVYRHLLYSLVAYKEDLTEFELDYLKRFRGNINVELAKYTKGELELTKNMSVVLFEDDSKEKFDFPNTKAISDIVLLVNASIVNRVSEAEIEVGENEVITISKEHFYRIIKETRKEYMPYFSKYYKDMIQDNFIAEVVSYMKEYDMVREVTLGYQIYPIVSKFVGYIPKDLEEQLNLFGGEENED